MDDNDVKKNHIKQEIYVNMKTNLKKALKAGFYYEAIFIEYAIIEDRCKSILKHADVKYVDSKGCELKLYSKLNIIKDNPKFVVPYVRKRITPEFIDRINSWKKQRDVFIHGLAQITYDNESVKQVATEGNEIVCILDNKSKSINNYFSKQKEER